LVDKELEVFSMAESQHTAADETSCGNIFSSGFNNFCSLLIASFCVLIVSFNILYPSPSGPPDNGDFSRIFASFSSGPLGHAFWPSPENQEAYQKRFYNFYHRFWRHDQGKEGFAQLSTSHLFFWPGRFLNLTPGTFDLAWNGFLLTLSVGLALYLSISSVGRVFALFSLGVFAFICADADVSGYLNSFYQESGTFLSSCWSVHCMFSGSAGIFSLY
jgi:hypothetical protein